MTSSVHPGTAHAPDIIVRGSAVGFLQEATAGQHRFVVDEPVNVGGENRGPTPYDLLLAALGACTSMTVGLYARRKHLPLEGITVSLWHARIHAEDCAECMTKEGMLDRIEIAIELAGPLSVEQRRRLIEVAGKCPVHRTLTSEISIRLRSSETM